MGAIRLFLALIVAFDHIQFVVLKPANIGVTRNYVLGMNAGFAVAFFYIISGFLISYVLSTKYADNGDGLLRFYKSRAIRIFSFYWPLASIVLVALPVARETFIHDSVWDKLTNIFLIGADWRIMFSVYPFEGWEATLPYLHQVWTLAPELTFYLIAPFLLRRNKLAVAVLLASLLTRTVLSFTIGWTGMWSYYFFGSIVCFFMIGHSAYKVSTRWEILSEPLLGCLLLYLSIFTLAVYFNPLWDSARFWISTLSFAASLPGIFRLTKDNRILNIAGELSFPVYLMHVLVMMGIAEISSFQLLLRSDTDLGVAVYLIAVLIAGAALNFAHPAFIAIGRRISQVLKLIPSNTLSRNLTGN